MDCHYQVILNGVTEELNLKLEISSYGMAGTWEYPEEGPEYELISAIDVDGVDRLPEMSRSQVIAAENYAFQRHLDYDADMKTDYQMGLYDDFLDDRW